MRKQSFDCNFQFCMETGEGTFGIVCDGSPREVAIDVIKILGKACDIDLTIMNEFDFEIVEKWEMIGND